MRFFKKRKEWLRGQLDILEREVGIYIREEVAKAENKIRTDLKNELNSLIEKEFRKYGFVKSKKGGRGKTKTIPTLNLEDLLKENSKDKELGQP